MPLPLILGAAALIAGGYGVKKGFDAKEDFDAAESYNSEAKETYDDAMSSLESKREKTQRALEDLGEIKFYIYEKSIIPFVRIYSQIKTINFLELNGFSNNNNVSEISSHDMIDLKSSATEMESIVAGGVSALGAGGLAGLAVYGGVGALGTASTGTAIGALSGVAATNATLAWLGGGSLAAGGFGVAGGMAVLGGIVAGPVLAVGGMMMSSKAEAAREDAYSNYLEAKKAAEEMGLAGDMVDAIRLRTEEIDKIIRSLNTRLQPALTQMATIVDRRNQIGNSFINWIKSFFGKSPASYTNYSDEEKRTIYACFSLAKTLKNVLEVPILNDNGKVTLESKELIKSPEVLSLMQ